MTTTLPNIQTFYFVDFIYQSGDTTRTEFYLTDAEDEIDLGGVVYTSDPTLDIEMPELAGDFADRSCRIRVADAYGEFRAMLSGRAFGVMTCKVREVSFSPLNLTNSTELIIWEGQVESGTISPEGVPGVVELNLAACGGTLEAEAGTMLSERCDNRFGDLKTCTVDLEALKETGTITAITRTALTVTGLTAPRANYWHGGYVILDGARIRIRSWTSDAPDTFRLNEFPPQSIVDQILPITATFYPGCDLSLANCRFYNNEDNFNAIGLTMPERNPLFEVD